MIDIGNCFDVSAR